MKIVRKSDGQLMLVKTDYTLADGEAFAAPEDDGVVELLEREVENAARREKADAALTRLAVVSNEQRKGIDTSSAQQTSTRAAVIEPDTKTDDDSDPHFTKQANGSRVARMGVGLDVFSKMTDGEARGGTKNWAHFVAKLYHDGAYRSDRMRLARASDQDLFETKALAEGATSSGGALVPAQYVQELLDIARSESVAAAAGVQFMAVNSNLVYLPTLVTAATASWVAENGAITPSDEVFGQQSGSLSKLGAGVKLSNEMVQDSDPAVMAIVQEDLAKVIALKLDLGIFEGTGVAPQIAGFKTISGLTAGPNIGVNGLSASTGGNVKNALDYIMDAIYNLAAVNLTDVERFSVVGNPRFFNSVRQIKDTTGNYILSESGGYNSPLQRPGFLGLPFYASSQLSVTETQGSSSNTQSIYVGRFYESKILTNGGFTIDFSTEAADATNSAFWSDQTWIRAKQRVGFLVRRPAGIVRITGFTP